ncbi:MAG: porin family protein [Bacteroidota bacterium]
MKKGFLLLLCSLVVFASYGQASFHLGLKGGLNYADLDTEISTETRRGFHAGAFATLKIAKVAIQPELIFSQQGASLRFDRNDLESNFSYLNIPVMLKLYLIGGLNVQIGPQFGFLMSADREVSDVLGNINEEDVTDLYESSDLSLGLGAGLDLPFGLTANARYNLGLSEIDNSESLAETSNQVFQISLGYRFLSLGK